MDERQLKKLRAAAEHLAAQAELAAQAAAKAGLKVERARAHVLDAEEAQENAERAAEELRDQAQDAAEEWRAAADGRSVTASAHCAAGDGGAS